MESHYKLKIKQLSLKYGISCADSCFATTDEDRKTKDILQHDISLEYTFNRKGEQCSLQLKFNIDVIYNTYYESIGY